MSELSEAQLEELRANLEEAAHTFNLLANIAWACGLHLNVEIPGLVKPVFPKSLDKPPKMSVRVWQEV